MLDATSRVYAPLLLLVIAACSDGGRNPKAAGPTLREIGVTQIAESATDPLGNFIVLARAADGRRFVGDDANGRVLVMSAEGHILQQIGKKGSGPGELDGVNTLALLRNDSLLAVLDGRERRLSLFSVRDGAFLSSMPTPMQGLGKALTLKGDTVLAGAEFSENLVARWVVGDSTVVLFGKTPQRLLTNTLLAATSGRVEVLPHESGLVAMLPTEPGLTLMNEAGDITGFVRVPVARRVGPPDDIHEIAAAELSNPDPTSGMKIRSAVWGFSRRPDGDLQLAYLDAVTAPPGKGGRGSMSADSVQLYVAIVRQKLDSACVDAPVPVTTIDPPWLQMRGDTVDVWVRELEGEATAVRLSSYVVSPEGCTWLPTGGILAPRP